MPELESTKQYFSKSFSSRCYAPCHQVHGLYTHVAVIICSCGPHNAHLIDYWGKHCHDCFVITAKFAFLLSRMLIIALTRCAFNMGEISKFHPLYQSNHMWTLKRLERLNKLAKIFYTFQELWKTIHYACFLNASLRINQDVLSTMQGSSWSRITILHHHIQWRYKFLQ